MEGNSESHSVERNSDSNSNSARTGSSQFNYNSGIGLGIWKKIQFRSGIDPGSAVESMNKITHLVYNDVQFSGPGTPGYNMVPLHTKMILFFFGLEEHTTRSAYHHI